MHVNWHLIKYLPGKCRRKKKYKCHLETRIKLKYPDEILFISPGYRIQEVVISRHCFERKTIAEFIQHPKKVVIQYCCNILWICRRHKFAFYWFYGYQKLTNYNVMKGNLQNYEGISMKRYYYLKTSQKHILVLLIHLVQTLCLQFQMAKNVTLKHFLLGLGLHSMIGMNNPINFLHGLGDSIWYDMVY